MKLTAKKVERLGPGMHGDGDGLWLQVVTPSRRSWLLRYQRHGKARAMGLGGYPAVSLADARDRAQAARKLLAQDIDPIDQRNAVRQEAEAEMARAKTFADAAEAYITAALQRACRRATLFVGAPHRAWHRPRRHRSSRRSP